MTSRGLNAKHIEALEARKISAETALKFGLFTGRTVCKEHGVARCAACEATDAPKHVIADPRGNILVFPYFEHDVEVNDKYRAAGKVFWQREGGKKTFYNADILDDPALRDGTYPLVIVEGEPDCLACDQSATPFVVSVPDGAPPVPKDRKPDDLDERKDTDDSTGKFEFVWNNRDRLKAIKKFIIAVDNDPPGKRLEAELVSRLNPGKCLFVEYPPQELVPVFDKQDKPTGKLRPCKDLNEVLQYIGPEAVVLVISKAKPYPVRGLYEIDDFPTPPPLQCAKTGWWPLDNLLKPFLSELMVVIGIPGHGKSAFISNLIANFSEQYAWRSVVFSPEEPVKPFMVEKLRSIRARREVLPMEVDVIEACDDWIKDNFKFIAADPSSEEDEAFDLKWLLERATEAVLRYGVKVLVIDPWNELEHAHRRNENQTEYTGRALRMLNTFRRVHNVMVIVLVHPTKDVGKDGKTRPPTPYDADGSAHFFNKADHFLIIHRPDKEKDESLIRVAKVKFKGTGKEGTVKLAFDRVTSRYELLGDKDENWKLGDD